MRLLLDTHVALWAIVGDARLSLAARLHQDPFDRLLVAQALEEPMTLVTHDAKVAAYSASFMKI